MDEPPAITLAAVTLEGDGGAKILRGVNLEIAKGECLALIGRSGAGKSSALRTINGLVIPTSGEVIVEGRSIASLREAERVSLRRRIGYVIQRVGLLPHLDVAQNVGLVLRLIRWRPDAIAARVDEVLTLVGLDPQRFRARSPSALSGGEQQRVGVARALAASPSIVLMDEPFAAVDPLQRGELQRDVDALRRRLGATVVLVTHDVREAIVMADRIALIDEGKVAVVGTPRELLEADHPVARAYEASLSSADEAIAAKLSRPAP